MGKLLKKLLLLYPIIYSTIFFAQAQEYQVSLLTCAPANQIHTTFGHSAIRIWNKETNQDRVYNYGTFDFEAPFFLLKFTQRTLDYMLSVTTYERFLLEYNYFQRNVREQVLDLSPEQTAKLIEFLDNNYQPENRFYRYDFFYDNCATRIRDVMEQVLGEQLDWNEDLLAERKTFRNLIDEYVYALAWADFGIDLALGSVIDVEATEREKQFLPDYMEAAFDRAVIVGDGPSRKLVKEKLEVLSFPARKSNMDLLNPYVVWWVFALLVVVLTFVGFRKKRLYKGFDIGLFSVLGLLGIVVVLLWFFTFHSQTKYNWNLLWALPTNLVLAFALLKKQVKPWVRKYLLTAMVLTNIALLVWVFGVQSFHPSIVPILLVILLRTNFLYYNLDRFALKKKA